MKKHIINFSKIAILLSVISILWTLYIESSIYDDYLSSTGKTKALFGLKLLFDYSYRFYLCAFGIVSLFLSFVAHRKNENQLYIIIAILLAISSILLPFMGIWKYFIH